MKAYGSGCIDPHLLDLGTSWRWVVNFKPRPLYPQINSPRYSLQSKQYRNKYDSGGGYRLKCRDCRLQYIGQTGQSFHTRYKEHILAIKYNKDTSTYAQHTLNMGHTYGNIQNTIEIIQRAKKGKYMNSIERHHIYCTHKQWKQMNEVLFDLQNPIFGVL
jgi:hypothetical protein